MFNVYSYDRKVALAEDLKRLKQDYVKEELLRKKKQNKLVVNYKRRIENFVLQMAEKPVIRHEAVAPRPKIRDEDPSKFLGPPKMIIQAFRHEKDRIKEAEGKNMEFGGPYISARFEFRKRDTSKEIHPQMRFTTKTKLEKLSERLNDLFAQSKLNSSTTKLPPKLDESILQELSKSPQATNKFLAQHLLPEMNMKTHFRAAECLYLNLPLSLIDKNVKKPMAPANPKPKSPQYTNHTNPDDDSPSPINRKAGGVTFQKGVTILEEEREQERKEKMLEKQQNQIEIVDPSEASKEMLLKCNIIKSKNPHAHTLMKGEGHKMIMSDMSIAQIYENVLHQPMNLRASI